MKYRMGRKTGANARREQGPSPVKGLGPFLFNGF